MLNDLRKYIRKNSNSANKNSIAYRCRKKRMQAFETFYEENILSNGEKAHTILDIGGTLRFWQSMDFKYFNKVSIVLLNLSKENIPSSVYNVSSVAGNAINLKEFDDKQFDLVFSNSVIEHVGDFNNQKKMANEMTRVGKHIYLQTPNRYFILEPHYLIPFFQFFPLRMKAYLIGHYQLGNYPKADNSIEAMRFAKSIRLMTKRELKQLFPQSKIVKERFCFMTKSFYLWK